MRRRAAAVSAKAKDVTEFLAGLDLPDGQDGLRLAYHSACSMQHGQKIRTEPLKLLRKAGFTVAEVPEGHLCCGSAGTYNILQPEIATRLRDRKVANIDVHGTAGDGHRQYRLHYADIHRHGHPHGPYGGTA